MCDYTIFLGGDISITERLKKQIKSSKKIAADGGIRHVKALNMVPDLWLGDFDSCSLEDYPEFSDVERLTYEKNKDKTDGALAIEVALKRGATRIILCGAFGGKRFDHAFSHITQAVRLEKNAIPVLLTSGFTEGVILRHGQYSFDYPSKTEFSIIGLTDIKGLTIKGACWELESYTVKFGSTLTLSNKVKENLEIKLNCGEAVLIANFIEDEKENCYNRDGDKVKE